MLRSDSKINFRLFRLVNQFNSSTKKRSAEQAEEIGIAISIDKGLTTGLLNEEEKNDFLNRLK